MITVLVTGGSGLVGHGIQQSLGSFKETTNQKWIFSDRQACNLLNREETFQYFRLIKPNYVIHCAADVGGLFKNLNKSLQMMQNNCTINSNVLAASFDVNVTKLVSVLSTCIFPDTIESYPFDESSIHQGPPHPSNEGYAYAKRMLEIESRLYRQQHGVDYICAIPTNIYGPHDNFHLNDAHVIPALIHNAFIAQESKGTLTILGSGNPLRQFLYSEDVGYILIWMLLFYKGKDSLILCETEEHSIGKIGKKIAACVDKTLVIQFDDTKADGQFKKTADGSKLRPLLPPHFSFTSIEEGIERTCEWFRNNKEKARK